MIKIEDARRYFGFSSSSSILSSDVCKYLDETGYITFKKIFDNYFDVTDSTTFYCFSHAQEILEKFFSDK